MKTGYYKLPLGAPPDEKAKVENKHIKKDLRDDSVRRSLLLASLLDDNMLDFLLAVEPYLDPDIKIAINSALRVKSSSSELSDSVNIRYAVEKNNKRNVKSQAEILQALSKSRFAKGRGIDNNLGKIVDIQNKFAKFNGSRDISPLLFEMFSSRINHGAKQNNPENKSPGGGRNNMDIINVMSMLRGAKPPNLRPMLGSGKNDANEAGAGSDKKEPSGQDRTMDILKLMSMLKMGSGGMDINSILPLIETMSKKG